MLLLGWEIWTFHIIISDFSLYLLENMIIARTYNISNLLLRHHKYKSSLPVN